jgi:hypothetical protein
MNKMDLELVKKYLKTLNWTLCRNEKWDVTWKVKDESYEYFFDLHNYHAPFCCLAVYSEYALVKQWVEHKDLDDLLSYLRFGKSPKSTDDFELFIQQKVGGA